MKKQALKPDVSGGVKKTRKKTVLVDLDNTLAEYSGWHGIDKIGDPLPGAVEFMRGLKEIARVVIFTTRTNTEINKEPVADLVAHVEKWLNDNGIEYDEVYSGQGKPMGACFVDDRAVECRPADSETPETVYAEVLEKVKGLIAKDKD